MPFPEVPRVIYENNPLVNVICQFRFPPILKIDSEVPSSFQEKIRDKFPLYFEKQELIQQINPGGSPNILGQLLAKQSPIKNHEFSSEDNLWKVNLTRTFITLSSANYKKWENFIERFTYILNAFNDIYLPPFFTRIGLRYQDVFNRSNLGLKDVSWSDLIKPEFLGLLSSTFANKVENFESAYEIKLTDNSSLVRMVISNVKEQASGESCFMVDSDFHNTERKKTDGALEKLEFLHERASKLIRCIITDKLHTAMIPVNI